MATVKSKQLSGWHLFIRQHMPQIKKNEDIYPHERLPIIGELWETLSEAEKQYWRTSASKSLSQFHPSVQTNLAEQIDEDEWHLITSPSIEEPILTEKLEYLNLTETKLEANNAIQCVIC
jgi:hypothetical protein